jgi:hypothetical protein
MKELANMTEVRMKPAAKGCAVMLFLALGAPTAFAQAPSQTPNQSGCTPQERGNKTLQNSDQQNSGVICPPDIDPAMKAPTPKTGDPSVIPAPGSPGGNPNVQPK